MAYRYNKRDAATLPRERTQRQMYYRAVEQAAAADRLFLSFVRDGLSAGELRRLIEHRPALWGRFSNWIEKLPETPGGCPALPCRDLTCETEPGAATSANHRSRIRHGEQE